MGGGPAEGFSTLQGIPSTRGEGARKEVVCGGDGDGIYEDMSGVPHPSLDVSSLSIELERRALELDDQPCGRPLHGVPGFCRALDPITHGDAVQPLDNESGAVLDGPGCLTPVGREEEVMNGARVHRSGVEVEKTSDAPEAVGDGAEGADFLVLRDGTRYLRTPFR